MAGLHLRGAGVAGMPNTDGRRDGWRERHCARPADMPMVSGDKKPGAGARLSLGEREQRSIHASSPRAPGWAAGEQEATRAVFLGPMEERGGGGRAGVHWLVL